jgi:hypothetical protein
VPEAKDYKFVEFNLALQRQNLYKARLFVEDRQYLRLYLLDQLWFLVSLHCEFEHPGKHGSTPFNGFWDLICARSTADSGLEGLIANYVSAGRSGMRAIGTSACRASNSPPHKAGRHLQGGNNAARTPEGRRQYA